MTTDHVVIDAPGLRRFKFNEDAVEGLGRLYVLTFDSGLLKVGRSATVETRLSNHIAVAAIHGAKPQQAWISKAHANVTANETRLIRHCVQIADLRLASEYFRGIDFHDVKSHAESLTFVEDRDTWLAMAREEERSVPGRAPRSDVQGRERPDNPFRGEVLRRLMTLRGCTVQGLADELGINRSTLFRLRGGGNPVFSVVAALADRLDVPVDVFLYEPVESDILPDLPASCGGVVADPPDTT